MSDVWMKTLREENFSGAILPTESYLLQEPAWRDSGGDAQYTVAGAPKGRPSWQRGDVVILYVGGRERTVGLVRVDGSPYESGAADWPWSTDTTGIVPEGPTLADLHIPSHMVSRRVRWKLNDAQVHRARKAFGF